MLGYAAYADRLAGSRADVGRQLPYRASSVSPICTLELFRVTKTWRPFPGDRLLELGPEQAHDALMPSGETAIAISPGGNVWLAPCRASWLILRP